MITPSPNASSELNTPPLPWYTVGKRRGCWSPTKTTPRCEREIARPEDCWKLPVFRAGSRSDNFSIIEQNCVNASGANRIHNGNGKPLFGLYGIQPGRARTVLCLRHGFELSFRRELPNGDARAKQSMRAFLPRLHPKRRLTNLSKRRHPNQLHHFKSGGSVGGRGIIKGTVHEYNGGKTFKTYPA